MKQKMKAGIACVLRGAVGACKSDNCRFWKGHWVACSGVMPCRDQMALSENSMRADWMFLLSHVLDP